MNERIFKLALKAMDFQGAVDTDTELKLTNSELEKFAELIVRECIREIGYKSVELLDIDFYPHYQERLKKHFGVSE